MKKNLFILLITLALAGSAAAQSPKGAEQLRAKPAAKTESNVDGKLSVLSSHIKSLGTIGHYEIASAKVRGLDVPNVTALLALDKETGQLAVLASGNAPGLGVAIVNGASTVGGSFVFGAKIRPDRTSVSNNSESEGSSAKSISEGGTAVSVSEGGDAVSVSDADAKASSSSAAVAASSSSAKNHNNIRNSNVNAQSQSQEQSSQNTNSRKNGNGPKSKKPKK